MFKQYFQSAMRIMLRHKGYSIISIAGLAIGMALFIIIVFFVRYEFSYDDFNENYDRVYRVEEFYSSNRAFGNYGQFPITPAPLAPTLVRNYPEIIDAARITGAGRQLLTTVAGDKKIYREKGKYADRSFFKIFSLPLIKGDPETALGEPLSMVLTEELAEVLFPGEEAVGKTIKVRDRYDCTVTGVAKKIPKNSHIKFDYLVSLSSLSDRTLENWDEEIVYSYILTQEEHSYKDINEKIANLLADKRKGDRKNDRVSLYLKPLSQVHHSNTNYELESSLPIELMYLILSIGILILMISCINFINLSTAYSSIRGKEVGVRKVLGAARFTLIKHYLSESVLLSFISFALAWVLAELWLPELNRLLNTDIGISLSGDWQFISALIGFTFFVGVLSGSYPAFLLSSFHPVKVLKGVVKPGKKGPAIRRVLVTSQFLLCVLFIILSIVIFKQGTYIKNMDKGYSENNIVTQWFDNSGDKNIDKFIVLKDELLKNPGILSASLSSNLPYAIYNDKKVNWEGSKKDEHIWITYSRIGNNFFDVYDLELLRGRKFLKEFSEEGENACIINEKALAMFGWDSPIGKRIGDENYKVVGVVKDFCSSDMRLGIKPVMLLPYRSSSIEGFYFSLALAPGTNAGSLGFIKRKLAEIMPDEAFEFRFFSDIIADTFVEFENINRLLTYFAVLSIILAALGLYAIASFSTQRRTKEIGIRKVIGASAAKVLLLVSKEFVKILIIANLIAWPIAYLFMNFFLRQFVFRIDLQVWMFLVPGLLVFAAAAVTVSYHTIKAAFTNPVEALRYE